MAATVCSRFLLQRSTQGFLFSSRSLPAFSSPLLSRSHRLGPSDDELYQRTTVSVMQKEPGGSLMIHSYSAQGFNIDEILVLGTGARVERIDPSVLALLKKKGIAVEVQDTPNACATFNFLTSERRMAAAGLIPPPVSTALDLLKE